jgi:hypothetical protein
MAEKNARKEVLAIKKAKSEIFNKKIKDRCEGRLAQVYKSRMESFKSFIKNKDVILPGNVRELDKKKIANSEMGTPEHALELIFRMFHRVSSAICRHGMYHDLRRKSIERVDRVITRDVAINISCAYFHGPRPDYNKGRMRRLAAIYLKAIKLIGKKWLVDFWIADHEAWPLILSGKDRDELYEAYDRMISELTVWTK